MFGRHNRNLDDKYRVVLPSPFKDELGEKFYLTIGLDKNVEIRSQDVFNQYINILNGKSEFDKNVRILKRFILGNTFEIELDKQGRISLPKHIIDSLALKKEVVFIGTGSIVELWSKEVLEEHESSISNDELSNIAQLLSQQ